MTDVRSYEIWYWHIHWAFPHTSFAATLFTACTIRRPFRREYEGDFAAMGTVFKWYGSESPLFSKISRIIHYHRVIWNVGSVLQENIPCKAGIHMVLYKWINKPIHASWKTEMLFQLWSFSRTIINFSISIQLCRSSDQIFIILARTDVCAVAERTTKFFWGINAVNCREQDNCFVHSIPVTVTLIFALLSAFLLITGTR